MKESPNQPKLIGRFFYLRKSVKSVLSAFKKKRTQPLRPYKSVLICAPDSNRGCVVCASYPRQPIAAPLNPPLKILVPKRFPESVVGAFLDVDVGQGHTIEGVVFHH